MRMHAPVPTHAHVRMHAPTFACAHTHTYTESVQPVLETEHRATSTNVTNGTLIHMTQWTMIVMEKGHQ